MGNVMKCEMWNECKMYVVVLIVIVFTISIGNGTYFIYCKYTNLNKKPASKHNYVYQTPNY